MTTSDPSVLCSLSVPHDDTVPAIHVLDALPSGRGLRLLIRQNGARSRIAAGALPVPLRDTTCGIAIADPVRHVRLLWARRLCAAHRGWPLHQLIGALLVDGFGPSTAADVARAVGTWERFLAAIDQLCTAEVPASREEFVLAHNARGRAVGLFEATPDALDHAAGLYPQPLSALLDACGPPAWQGLRSWGFSPEREAEAAELLAIGAPLPFADGDYDAFLRERFTAD